MPNNQEKDCVNRIDYLNDLNGIEKKFELTEDGYLEGQAIITNIGVFPYMIADGVIQYELRSQEEVFNEDSLKSLAQKPITDDHPKEARISIDNIKEYQRGYTGSNIQVDGLHVAAPITITDRELIDKIQSKKKTALSAGYTCNLLYKTGTYLGMYYDAIQTNIRYNHIAVVNKARAGDAAKIKIDNTGDKIPVKHKEEAMLKKINIDGVEFEAETEVIQALTKSKNDLQLKVDAMAELEKKYKNDTAKLQASIDQLTEDLKKASEKKEDASKLDAAIEEKMAIMGACLKSGVEFKKDASNLDMKKEVILKLNPEAKEKIDNAEEVYINARFDIALEKLETQKPENELKGDTTDTHVEKNDSNSARESMIEYYKTAHMTGGK